MEIKYHPIPVGRTFTLYKFYLPGFLEIISIAINPCYPLQPVNLVQNTGKLIDRKLPPIPLSNTDKVLYRSKVIRQSIYQTAVSSNIVLRPIDSPYSPYSYELWNGYNHLQILNELFTQQKIKDSTFVRVGIIKGLPTNNDKVDGTDNKLISYMAYQRYIKQHHVS